MYTVADTFANMGLESSGTYLTGRSQAVPMQKKDATPPTSKTKPPAGMHNRQVSFQDEVGDSLT